MRRARVSILGIAALTFAASAEAQSVGAPGNGLAQLAVGAVVLGLIGMLAFNLVLRRSIGERQRAYEQQEAEKARTERQLRQTREALESELAHKQSELDSAYRQLDATRARLDAVELQLAKLSRVDELTGIANRQRFNEALEQEIKRMLRDRSPLTVVLCEPDYFPAYAVANGQDRATECLSKIAGALEDTFRRAGDLVARFNQTRFAIIMPATDADTAGRFGDRLLRTVWGLCIPHDGSEVADRMTVSAGLATMLPNRLFKAKELVQAAERALANACEQGRNRVERELLS